MNSNGGVGLAEASESYDPIPPIEDLAEPTFFATAWQRFWSKNLDIAILSLGVGAAVGYLFPEFFLAQLSNDPSGRLLGLMILPVVFAVDAIILSMFGNTLGRALIGIRVETLDRSRLDILTAIGRGLRVWCFGCAFGIPIATLFTYKANFDKLKRGELTSWDDGLGTRVRQTDTSTIRTSLVGIAAIITLAGSAVLDRVLDDQAMSDTTATVADYVTNPGSAADIPDPIEKELQQAAAELKPGMSDSITRLDGARAQGRRFIYDFSILRRDISDDALREYVRTKVRAQMCANADTSKLMRDYSVTYTYNYTFPNADVPVSEDISWEDC